MSKRIEPRAPSVDALYALQLPTNSRADQPGTLVAPPVAPSQPARFTHRLQPTWGDSDPARMIYTGRYPDFALRAIDAWMLAHVGVDFYAMNMDWGIGTPFVHLECDFRSPATPRDVLLIAVHVEKVGQSSLAFRVAATIEADGRLCFEGRFVCVCVDGATQSQQGARPMPLDPRIRAAAEAACAGGPLACARTSTSG